MCWAAWARRAEVGRSVDEHRAPEVFGRDEDLAWLGGFLDQARASGASTLLHGEPGVGKSTLLEFAHRGALERDMRVLAAEGAEFESELAYAGLNQLLGPLLGSLGEL